ncbi:MAG: HigA family addiction module antitoxin [Cyanobacteria bacterium P01_G01_bin.54]
MTDSNASFTPDWASPPGETIADWLAEQGLSKVDLAAQLGLTTQQVDDLIQGNLEIEPGLALKLSQVLGNTARFWLDREAQYRTQLARVEMGVGS